MNSAALLVLLVALSGQASSFDYARYEASDVDALIERAAAFDVHESGQSVLTPPLAVHLRAAIVSFPQACPDELPRMFLRVVRVPDPPSMKWCMRVKGKSGETVNLWLQDSFAHLVSEEYRIGGEIELWALWLFVNASDRKPYFVVNAIGPSVEPGQQRPRAVRSRRVLGFLPGPTVTYQPTGRDCIVYYNQWPLGTKYGVKCSSGTWQVLSS